MTTDSVTIAAAPEAVFAVLLDAHAYGEWVVGSNIIRRVDDSWPAIGSRFHHSIGAGPFNVNDSTEVIDVDPPHRLVLEARMRPFLTARVILESTRVPAGTCVTMTEEPTNGLFALGGPLFDPLLSIRNRASLRRLRTLAERRSI